MARIFFFTSFSGFHLHARTTRSSASKQTLTIMEFPRAFNEERLQVSERRRCPPAKPEFLRRYRLGRIMAVEEFSRFPRGGPCPPKNFPTPRSQRCSPRPKGGAW